MIKIALIQHFMGLAGQISAALPMLLITIFISRFIGIEDAGYFSVFVGTSAIIFSISLWGLRPYIVLDRFLEFRDFEYFNFRCITIFFSSILMLIFADHSKLSLILIVNVILFRSIDSFIDINMGFDQINKSNTVAIRNFSLRHFIKTSTILIIMASVIIFYEINGFVNEDVFFLSLMLPGIIILSLNLFFQNMTGKRDKIKFKNINLFLILRSASLFALASICCAFITNIPRISITSFFETNDIGVVGVTLSVTAFFGMFFNMTWIRALPSFSLAKNNRKVAKNFILENIFIALILIFLSYYIFPYLVSFVFDFSGERNLVISRNVMLCATIFFLGQVFSNLFKVTSKPWLEIISYFIGGLTGFLSWIIFGGGDGYYLMLINSGIFMALFSVFLFVRLNYGQQLK